MVGFSELPRVFSFCAQDRGWLRWIIPAWCALAVASWLGVWFYPIYFERTGWNIQEQGRIFAFYNLIACVASLTARRFKSRTEMLYPIFAGLALASVTAHLLFGLIATSWGFLFGLLHQINRGATPVVFSSAVHERTPSHIRATVLSMQGALVTTMYGAINLRLGWAAEIYGFQSVLVGVSAAVAMWMIAMWLTRPNEIGSDASSRG
jgi:hypothetical protein